MDDAGHMYAMDAANGSVLWDFEGGANCLGGAAISGGMAFWGTGYGPQGASPDCRASQHQRSRLALALRLWPDGAVLDHDAWDVARPARPRVTVTRDKRESFEGRLVSILMLVVFKRTSDQAALAAVKRRICRSAAPRCQVRHFDATLVRSARGHPERTALSSAHVVDTEFATS
jgi:hypothetical protein